MHNGDDLAFVFSIRPIDRVQQEELIGAACKVAAWNVPFAAFDHHQQAARLAGIIGFGVF
jgi:hypothetical protein